MKKLKAFKVITFLLILISSSIIGITHGSPFQNAKANVVVSDRSVECPVIYIPDIEKPGIVNIRFVQNLKLAEGTSVEVLSEESDGWWKVKVNGTVAYIPNKSLKGYTAKTMKTASSLNLRKGIRKKNKIILSLAEKFELDAIEDLNKDIEYTATLDYAPGEAPAKNKATELAEVEVDPVVGESAAEQESQENKVADSKPVEKLATKSAEAPKANVSVTKSEPASTSFVKTMYVTTSLNMRSGPSAEYPVIRSLAYNSEL
ncbi:MAG: hypothetical protein GX752_05115, partial [Clostridium sp.]|nr:hypothetical protein [Clostridium sp.]